MPDTTAHPSHEQLSAYNLGQLPPDEAVVIESHISECHPCCETIVGLSSDDTFVGLLKEARQLPTDQTADHDSVPAKPSATLPDVPAPLAEHTRYEVLCLIGKGGMGDVYKARHRKMERTVALKVINRELVRKPEAVDRFHREVKTAAQLSHPNIVTAYDADQVGYFHFMVMEYVDGVDLSQTVKDRGAMPIAEACDYIRQAAIGLQHAHEQGMVHRDIKPHNLMVTADGTVKILDFGLASLAPEAVPDADNVEARSDLTAAGSIMGTPDFISPEQADDARGADIRSDIYSLGTTLYFLLSGRPPFSDGSVMQKLKSHAQAEPEPLESLRDDIPADLAAIVTRMTAKNPDERFQTPAEVAAALKSFSVASLDGPSAAKKNGPTPAKNGLLFRLYRRAVAAGIMTPKEAEMQARRLADLLWFLPVVAIILIGFWSHRQFGSDGITGVLLGLYGLAYLAILVPRLETETASPLRRMVSRHRKAVTILFLLCIVGGALEMAAKFNLSGLTANKAQTDYEDVRSYFPGTRGGDATKPDIWSRGPDGKDETDDDIRNPSKNSAQETDPETDKSVKELLDTLNKLGEVLDSVKDGPTARLAAPNVKRLAQQIQQQLEVLTGDDPNPFGQPRPNAQQCLEINQCLTSVETKTSRLRSLQHKDVSSLVESELSRIRELRPKFSPPQHSAESEDPVNNQQPKDNQ